MLHKLIRVVLTVVFWPVAALAVIVPSLGRWFDELRRDPDEADEDLGP